MSMRFDEHFIKHALPSVEISAHTFPHDPRFSIDTRTLKEGDIFIAIEGAHNDGHAFLEDALKKGASGLIIAQHKKELLAKIDQKNFVDQTPLYCLFSKGGEEEIDKEEGKEEKESRDLRFLFFIILHIFVFILLFPPL